MSAVPHKLDCKDYASWLDTEAATRMLALQSSWIQHNITRLSGLRLMYQGLDHDAGLLKTSPVKHCFRMGLPWQQGVIAADAWMTSSDWPLPDSAIDVVVLQHSLDFSRNPHQVIREASRTIAPNGYLVIIGFNPYSLWGGAKMLLPFASEMPWVANAVSASRLCDWLTLLDFNIQSHETMGHIGSLTFLPRRFCLRVDSVLAGNPMMLGNYYMMVAHKKVEGMTPIRNKYWTMPERQLGWAKSISHQVKLDETNI